MPPKKNKSGGGSNKRKAPGRGAGSAGSAGAAAAPRPSNGPASIARGASPAPAGRIRGVVGPLTGAAPGSAAATAGPMEVDRPDGAGDDGAAAAAPAAPARAGAPRPAMDALAAARLRQYRGGGSSARGAAPADDGSSSDEEEASGAAGSGGDDSGARRDDGGRPVKRQRPESGAADPLLNAPPSGDIRTMSWNMQSRDGADIPRGPFFTLLGELDANVVCVQEPPRFLKDPRQGTFTADGRAPPDAESVSFTRLTAPDTDCVVLYRNVPGLLVRCQAIRVPQLGQHRGRDHDRAVLEATVTQGGTTLRIWTVHAPYKDATAANAYMTHLFGLAAAMRIAKERDPTAPAPPDVIMGDVNLYGPFRPERAGGYQCILQSPTSNQGRGSPLDQIYVRPGWNPDPADGPICGRFVHDDVSALSRQDAASGLVRDLPGGDFIRRSDHIPVYANFPVEPQAVGAPAAAAAAPAASSAPPSRPPPASSDAARAIQASRDRIAYLEMARGEAKSAEEREPFDAEIAGLRSRIRALGKLD